MKSAKCNSMRAVNDVLSVQPDESPFVIRLYRHVYESVIKLKSYMSKTMCKRVYDIAEAVTTLAIYYLYDVNGRENGHHAIQFLCQFKCLRVFANNLCECLTIHDLEDEISNKVMTIGKPLFNFINKNY